MSVSSRGSRKVSKTNSFLEENGRRGQAPDELAGFGDQSVSLDFALRGAGLAGPDAAIAGTSTSAHAAAGAAGHGDPEDARAPSGPGSQQIATVFTAANGPGSVAIIGYNTGGTDSQGTTLDSIQFVILKAIGSGTVIRFTDRSWNGSAFVAGGADGSFAFTAGADLAAGTVVSATFSGGNVVFTVNGVASAPISAGGFDLEQAGDAIYVYQGTDANTPTAFLHAIEIADGNSIFNGSLANTGLVAGDTAVAIRYDSAAYHGPTTDAFAHFHNGDNLLQNITDSTNWNGDDHGGQIGHDQFEQTVFNVAPDVSFWLAAGGGGNGIVSTHVDSTVGGGAQGHNMVIRYENDQGDMVQVFANPRDISFDTAEGKFFIVDTTAGLNGRILQGNISDLIGNPTTPPTMTVLYTSNQPLGNLESQIRDLQIDTINNIIYFTHGQRLEKISYNTAGQTSTVLAQIGGTGSGNPNGTANSGFIDDFVINFATGDIYLTAHRVIAGQDGDQVTRNFLYKISGLTPSSGTNFATWGNGLITTMNFSPDDNDTVHPLDMPGEAFPQELGTLEGVALSADGNTLYFTTASILWDHDGDGGFSGPGGFGTPPQLRMGGVYSYALTDNPNGVYTLIWQQQDDGDTNSQTISEIFGPQGLLDDIEVDPVTGHLYFLDLTGDQLIIGGVSQNPPGDEGIWRINPNGTGLEFIQAIFNNDGLGAGSLFLNRAPTVISSTQATPTVTEPGGNPGTGSGATALVQPFVALDVTDIETASNPTQQLNSAVIWISNNFQSGVTHQDTLTINGTQSGTVNGITYAYNAATGAMTLTGITTFNNYEATIALVRFNTSGDNPTAFGTATSRTISWAVSDGLNHSDPVSTTVTVVGVNDAPVNTVGGAMNFTEDTTGTAGVPAPPPPPVNAVTGISVFDVDADPATQNLTVTLSVNVGTLDIRTDVTGGITAGMITDGANGTGTIIITATQNQINATLAATNNAAAPNGLVYTPPANFNGAASLTVTTNDNGLSGNDPGNSGTGTTEQDVDVKILNVADVNDAPTVVDSTQDSPTILEDVPFTNANAPTVSSLFGASFSDATDVQFVPVTNTTGSPGDLFAGIAIVSATSNANGAWQYWDGDSWENITGGTLAAARTLTAGTQLRFNPTLNYNGPAPTLTVHLIESGGPAITNNGTVNLSGGGATGGTTVYSAGTVVLAQDITPVNDAPTQAGIAGDSVTFTEGQALAALLDAGSNAVVLDVDSPNFDTGTLTVAITGGLVAAEDRLVIRLTGTVSFNATQVFVNGTPIGTYSGHNSSGPLVFTFNAAATPAAVAELIRAVAYNNVGGDNPTDGNRTISWTLVDGDGQANMGQDTLTFTSTVDVNPVNDAPQGTDATFVIDEDGSRTLSQADFGFSDPAEGNAFAGVVLTTLPASGDLYLNGIAITVASTFITAADIAAGLLTYQPDPNGNGIGYATFTFQVRDNGGIFNGGQDTDQSPNTITFDVTAVNDAPVNGAPGAQSVNEDQSLVLSTANGNALSVTDVDAVTLSVTLSVAQGTLTIASTLGLSFGAGDGTADATMTFTGTAAAINAALGAGLTYNPNADFNGSDAITVFTTDNGQSGGPAQTDSDSITVNITAINDAPVVIGDGDEEAAPILQDTPTGGQSVSSLFSGQYSDAADAQFSLSNPGGSLPGTFSGIAVVANGSSVAEGQWQYLDGATWTDIGTVSPSAALLIGSGINIRFNPAAGFTGPAPTLTVHLIDNSLPFGIDFDVVDISGPGATGGTTAYSALQVLLSQQVNVAGARPVIDLNGVDSGIDNATAYQENDGSAPIAPDLVVSDAEDLNLEGATVQITGGFIPNFDYLTVNGATGPASLLGINFSYSASTGILTLTGSAPLADYQAVLRQVGFESTSDTPGTSRTISWTVNDGVLNSTPAAVTTVTVTEVNDTPTVDVVDVGPATEQVAFDIRNAITLADADSGSGQISVDVVVGFGVLNGAAGTTGVILFGLGTAGVRITGTLSQVSDFLTNGGASLTFTADSDAPPASTSLTVTIIDNGFTGVDPGLSGSATDEEATGTSTISITAVNDPAVITGTVTGVVTEAGGIANGTPGVPTASADLDAADPDNVADAWQAVAAGAATANGYGTFELTAAGVWTYTLDDNNAAVNALNGVATLSDSFSVQTIDGTSQTINITINAQDDAAVARADYVTTDPGALVAGNLFADNGSGADSDVDSPSMTVAEVNGSGASVGTPIVLASGGQLTVNANGNFSYTAPNSTLGTDSFTYTLAGGSTATVTLGINQVIFGTPDPDILTGGAGNDMIFGLASADTMTGGLGNDSYFVDDADDVVIETAGEGLDTIYTSVNNYVLAAGISIEGLSTAHQPGTTAQNLTGNELDNAIYGNDGVNHLDGAGGHDLLVGFAGDDVYSVDAEDEIVEVAGGGYDIAYARGDYVLRAGVEVEVLSAVNQGSTAAQNLTGNELSNTIYGNAGANRLEGGGGSDALIGFGGDDIYFANADDAIFESIDGGYDTLFIAGHYQLDDSVYIETLSSRQQAAATAQNLTGNVHDNVIYGNQGANVIDGGDGNDILIGFGGADTFAFTTALGAGNVDTIFDFESGTDQIGLSAAVFGLGAGPLDPGAFVLGTAALDADDRILYDQTTGALYYDADGVGAGAAVLFAYVYGAPPLSNGDFTVI